MAAIISASIDVSKLPKEKFIKGKKGVWYNFTISVNDESKYGNNVSLTDSQTKEEREAGKPKDYLGNGKVIWTNGSITKAELEAQAVAQTESVEDLF
jgi:hypothetical protein